MRIFSHEDRISDDLKKEGLHVILGAIFSNKKKLGTMFFKSKHAGCHFCSNFQRVFQDFQRFCKSFQIFCSDVQGFCPDFQVFFPDFHQINTFGGALAQIFVEFRFIANTIWKNCQLFV